MEQKLKRDRNIGQNLRRLRMDYNLSQEKLCIELQQRGYDVARSTYAKYENGELNVPVSLVMELKHYYPCQYDDFFVGLYKPNQQ